MENKLTEMIRAKRIETPQQIDMAVKEVLQELILAALSTTDFFSKAAFYGGTALRIFYGLRRFSEDLDFTMISPNPDFSWGPYFSQIKSHFARYGLMVEAVEREKVVSTDTRSAFIKQNTIETMKILLPADIVMPPLNHNQVTKIKFEVDTMPPEGATYQWLNLSEPFFSNVRVLDLPSLFAGKISAVLLRHWGSRIKGRDFYDYLYYVGRGAKINMAFLSANLEKAGVVSNPFTIVELKKMLAERFASIDFQEAALEASFFLENPEETKLWGLDYFLNTLDRLIEA